MNDLSACVQFLQRLIQTPSLPGEEEAVAQLVMAEMEKLDYDEIYADQAGNVIGLIKGSGEAPAVMFNTHLDHVDVGEHSAWPHPPFGGEIHDDRVWGRGAVDIKGPLAAQVYGAAQLKSKGKKPSGDVYVTGVVFEEIGGVGARHMAGNLSVPYVIIGEPSNNELRRGHRGRIELVLHVKGKSVHASVPQNGVNPLEVVARFTQEIKALKMSTDPDLGTSSAAPTLIRTDQISANVVPGEVWLTIDWRNIPAEHESDVQLRLQKVAETCLIEGAEATVSIPVQARSCYTGLKMDIAACNTPFITRANDPSLIAAEQVLTTALGSPPTVGHWRFATDGGHFARKGATCIGFAPGDESLAHTVDEHIPIVQLETALNANEALALHWARMIGD